MKSTIVQKYLPVLILVFFIVCQLPYASAFADTNSPVSDLFNKEPETIPEINSNTDTEIPPADLTTDKAEVGSSVGDYIKTLFALLFVLGLLFGLLKLVNRKNKLYDKNRLMKNMGGISLGQQKSIQLVVIGESYYLVGVGDDIRLLKEITDLEEINKLAEFYNSDSSDSATGMLSRLLMTVTGKSKKSPYEKSKESTDFSGIFQTKLDEMKEERKRHIDRLTEKGRDQDE